MSCVHFETENIRPKRDGDLTRDGWQDKDNPTFVDPSTGHRIKVLSRAREDSEADEPYNTCVAGRLGVGPEVYSTYNTAGATYLVMQNMEEGDLDDMLDKSRERNFALDGEMDDALVELFHAFARAEAPLCHEDLHINNVAFSRTPEGALFARAIDWGISSLRKDCRVRGFRALMSDIPRRRLPKFYAVLKENHVDAADTPIKERPEGASRADAVAPRTLF